jgi:hypothetical protein
VVAGLAPLVGADDYGLLVDTERGVILDVGFDEAIPEGTFILELPGVKFGEPERLT